MLAKSCSFSFRVLILAALVNVGALGAICAAETSWRLLRSVDPRGGTALVSMVKIADVARSEPDFAALMIRCSTVGFDSIFALVVPMSRRARLEIEWQVDDQTPVRVSARVLQPPMTIGLQEGDQKAFLAGVARGHRLSVQVRDSGVEVTRGEVDLAGTADALRQLATQCPIGIR